MIYKEIINNYFSLFEEGKTYNYYLDRFRYSSEDTWATKEQWVNIAKRCIKNKTNIIQALEILIREEFDKYYKLADSILLEWKLEGAYDIGAYYDLIFSMPKDYALRREIVGDYSEYLIDDSWGYAKLARATLLRNGDKDFLNIYGNYINNFIEKNIGDFHKMESFLEFSNIVYFGNNIYNYIDEKNLKNLKIFLYEHIKNDKLIANRILNDNNFIFTNSRNIWIADKIAEISFFLGFFDVLDYLLHEDWYWIFLFDNEYGYEDTNNSNLLVWSNYSCNSVLKRRAKDIIETGNNELDGVIALYRMRVFE